MAVGKVTRKGSPNKKSQYPRNRVLSNQRITEGFEQTMALLKKELGCSYSDILHDAVQQYAYKRISNKKLLVAVNKIQ